MKNLLNVEFIINNYYSIRNKNCAFNKTISLFLLLSFLNRLKECIAQQTMIELNCDKLTFS